MDKFNQKVFIDTVTRAWTLQSHIPDLHDASLKIITDEIKATRVWNGLVAKLSVEKRNEIIKTFLSELPERETILLSFFRHVFASGKNIERDFAHQSVLAITQVAHKVHREKHRMEAFVRFKRTADDLYYALVEPDYNVLPLIAKHFRERFSDQNWMIYDQRRVYGIQYDKNTRLLTEVHMMLNAINEIEKRNPSLLFHDQELIYQKLWKEYFKSVNIGARKNTKLHLKHLPVRYWKFLTEKI